MSKYGQMSRYGAIAKMLPFGDGKVFFVKQTADDDYGDFQHVFPPDEDGVIRVYSTIQAAITAAGPGDTVLVFPGEMAATDTDPISYAETVIIAAGKSNLNLIGVPDGVAQGRLPQIKKGSGSTAQLTVRSPGCRIANFGFNGASATGGGILLDDDGGTAKTAFGTVIEGCHFKNCKGSTATNAATGGAIQWSSAGGAWQVLIRNNRFYKNVGDIVLLGTTSSVPQDVTIENNIFGGPASSVDCNLYLAGGSGMNGVTIRNCTFQQLPALSSGTNVRYIDATGCTGMLVGCTFGCQTNPTGGTQLTFKAAGTGAKIPTTMHIADCWGQSINSGETGIVTIA